MNLTAKQIVQKCRPDWVAVGTEGIECPQCHAEGKHVIGIHYITQDMAIDAGDRSLEGLIHSEEYENCGLCQGGCLITWTEALETLSDEEVVKAVYPSAGSLTSGWPPEVTIASSFVLPSKRLGKGDDPVDAYADARRRIVEQLKEK